MGAWRCAWGKTRSATKSESEEEENQFEEEEEEASDASIDYEEKEKQAEQQFEEVMYKCYLYEKNYNPWKFSWTMSEPLNMDSDGEEIQGMNIDGEPEYGDEVVIYSEEEDEDSDEGVGNGPFPSSSNDDGGDYYYEDEFGSSSDSEEHSCVAEEVQAKGGFNSRHDMMKNKEKTDEGSLINNKSKTDNTEPSSNIIAK
ncbi:cilia- and flagella-associated protein 251-like [Papaver somniferum]|uniref:cilia- and flagella-associated protein 251-like n=1 Tax=Papaver somniferum TaxID=3469 RepID=UPI000E6FE0AC|nr:cilia- and flagella-associated protein 251-like [Papaver somniferum]